jgi:hypothetical protein
MDGRWTIPINHLIVDLELRIMSDHGYGEDNWSERSACAARAAL